MQRSAFVTPRRSDVLLAVAVTALSLAGLLVGALMSRPPLYAAGPFVIALSVIQGMVLLWRRRWPVAVLLVSCAAVALLGVMQHPSAASPLGPLVATYSLGALATRRGQDLVIVPAVGLLAWTKSGFTLAVGGGPATRVSFLITSGLLYGGALLLGRLVRSRREASEQRTRAAVAEERTRIARELHDVVAHHVGVMVLHAGAGRRLVQQDPAAAEEAMRQVELSGRAALEAMPSLLGDLRDPGVPPDRAPQPGVQDLAGLVDGVRGTGLRATLEQEGDVAVLSAAVQLTAYRIVQEALTNAAKHAGPARVRVRLRVLDDTVYLDITDDGVGSTSSTTHGFGLIGISERVRGAGGTCRFGPEPGGGFGVHAALPVAPVGAR